MNMLHESRCKVFQIGWSINLNLLNNDCHILHMSHKHALTLYFNPHFFFKSSAVLLSNEMKSFHRVIQCACRNGGNMYTNKNETKLCLNGRIVRHKLSTKSIFEFEFNVLTCSECFLTKGLQLNLCLLVIILEILFAQNMST
jgi:hypothetical protein